MNEYEIRTRYSISNIYIYIYIYDIIHMKSLHDQNSECNHIIKVDVKILTFFVKENPYKFCIYSDLK